MEIGDLNKLKEEERKYREALKRGIIEEDSDSEENQCDGCRAGYEVVNGIHKVPYPSGNMICQKEKYK